ncbi:MAG TPA: SDR family NAD(P)-dependent oxidoreductase [Chitinophagales bacterium]|nr:SDR family NAD(P)-dependent oxidoreductase [Chitinophagales bacterium]
MDSSSKLLAGKTALITGGTRGIGYAVAKLFAENGANLVLVATNAGLLAERKKELEAEYGIKVWVYSCDVANFEEVKNVYAQLLKESVSLNILVNNAGVMQDAVIGMVTQPLIEKVFSVNVYGTMYNSQLAIKSMLRSRGGSIINLSSIVGTNGNSGQSIYSASKAAVIGFTKSLSKELAALNIRVNAIAPGFIDTDMIKAVPPAFYTKNLENIRMKRLGTAEDVAKAALFLASDLSVYITGQVLGVDGGMLM